MLDYTVYDKPTGQVLRQVSKPKVDGPPELRDGESFILGDCNPREQKVENGKLKKRNNPKKSKETPNPIFKDKLFKQLQGKSLEETKAWVESNVNSLDEIKELFALLIRLSV